MTKPAKRQPGRPPNSSLDPVELQAREKAQVVTRHKSDLRSLRGHLKTFDQVAKGEALPTADLQRLAKTTELVHSMERQTYDLGDKGTKVNAVIIVPALASSMEQWQGLAAQVLPPDQVPVAAEAQVIEDDVQGDVPEEQEK